MKKLGKTTRPFRYDLNQITYNYTGDVADGFKGLDLIECLKNYGQRFVTVYRQQKQDKELTVAQIMNFLLPNSQT